MKHCGSPRELSAHPFHVRERGRGKGGKQPLPTILFAGQICGVEGYTESIATGMLAGIYAAALARGEEPTPVPRATALGSLVHYITHADQKNFQPANITFDLLEPLEEEVRKKIRDKKERHRIQCERSLAAFDAWRAQRFFAPGGETPIASGAYKR